MDFFWVFFFFIDRPWNPLRRKYWNAYYELEKRFHEIVKEKKENLLNNPKEDQDDVKKTEKDLLTLMLEANMDSDNSTLSDVEIIVYSVLLTTEQS